MIEIGDEVGMSNLLDDLLTLISHWKNKIIPTAIMGLFGLIIFTSCTINEFAEPPSLTDINPCREEVDRDFFNGLSCPDGTTCTFAFRFEGPIDEQKALCMIRSHLEDAGVILEEPAQLYSIEEDINVVLINEENEIVIVLVNHWSDQLDSEETRVTFSEDVKQQFEDSFGIFVDVVFFNQTEFSSSRNPYEALESIEEFREAFEKDLFEQVQDFIQQLRAEGIID